MDKKLDAALARLDAMREYDRDTGAAIPTIGLALALLIVASAAWLIAN